MANPPAQSSDNVLSAEDEQAMLEQHSFMLEQMEKGDTSAVSHSMPNIDCPLRKAGINPHQLKPFDEVEKYIAFLERPDRIQWQRPDEVVKALNLKAGDVIADIGAGSGYFSFRFVDKLTTGKVIALDTEPEMIRHIHHKSVSLGLNNLEAKIISKEKPEVGEPVDVVFICDVLHHVENRVEWLKQVSATMKSNSRLILIEFAEGELPEGPPASLKIPKAQLLKVTEQAGLKLTTDHSELLPYQVMLEFKKVH